MKGCDVTIKNQETFKVTKLVYVFRHSDSRSNNDFLNLSVKKNFISYTIFFRTHSLTCFIIFSLFLATLFI